MAVGVITGTDTAVLLRGAWAALRANQLQYAQSMCEQVLGNDPANFDALRMLAIARKGLGDDAGTGEALKRAHALRPGDAGTAYDYGSWLLAHDQAAAARPLLQRAAQLMPLDARIAFRHGTACFRDNDFAAAAESFRAAVAADAGWSEAWNNLSASLSRLQDYPAAIAAARHAMQLQPDKAAYHQALAALMSNLFDETSLREGLAAANRALQLQPDLAEAHRNAAILLRKLGDPVRAEVHARHAYRLAPLDPDVIETLGDQLMLNGRNHEAAELYAAAKRSGVESLGVIRQHGIALLHDQRADEARAVLTDSLALAPGDQRAIAHLGLALAEVEGMDAAVEFIGLHRHIHAMALPPPPNFDACEFHRALAADIRKHSQQRWEPAGLAARNAYLSGDLLADRTPAIVGFEQRLREAIDSFLAACRERRAAGASDVFLDNIPGAYRLHVWATLAAQSGYIDTHIHEDSWLSGAYYVELPTAIDSDGSAGAGWIEFGRPLAGLPQWPEHALRRVRPQVGTLLLFPSYLFHRTLPYAGPGERISISFDLAAA
jgi:uncharacterized protein (TIGR02466 family)